MVQDIISPLWSPSVEQIEHSRLFAFMQFVEKRTGQSFDHYDDIHRWSLDGAELFWRAVWDFCGVQGDQGEHVIEAINRVPYVRFFPDSRINYAENALQFCDRFADNPAIIGRCQDGDDRIISWSELSGRVSQWVQYFQSQNIQKGDRIAIYLPNVPETVFVFLAAASIGAVLVSSGMEMGQADLINRFSQVEPKILVTQSYYTHGDKTISRDTVVEAVVQAIQSIEHVVFIDHDKDMSVIHDFKTRALAFERFEFNHPLYILFSSGSSGKPKCFEHSAGGVLLKHLSEMQLNTDIRPGDRLFYHATPSWMMWNWLVSGLTSGATILMYDGNPFYPDASVQWQFTADHACTHHGSAAPVILGWQNANLDLKTGAHATEMPELRHILSTGAVLPEQAFHYIHDYIKEDIKISSITGGTDLVGCFLGGNPFASTYAGQINGPMIGCDVQVWDAQGHHVDDGESGELVCVNSFPSMPVRFLNDIEGERYQDAYFSAYPDRNIWCHGDTIYKTAQKQIVMVGRSDATLNQNGVRIGTSAIYDQLISFNALSDYAAIDFIRPDNKQAITVLFVVMHDGFKLSDVLRKQIKVAIKDNITPYAVPTEIFAVPDILKTPNGKKAEIVMKTVLSGRDIPEPDLYGSDLVHIFEGIGHTLMERYG